MQRDDKPQKGPTNAPSSAQNELRKESTFDIFLGICSSPASVIFVLLTIAIPLWLVADVISLLVNGETSTPLDTGKVLRVFNLLLRAL